MKALNRELIDEVIKLSMDYKKMDYEKNGGK
jgi:hypothetical protein